MPEICFIMKYIRLRSTDPYYNLALEEYLLTQRDEDFFLLWQNRPVVVIGKNQNAYAEVNLAYAKEHGIDVCRRITGGGAVYHDLGNVNYSFITSAQKAEMLDYAYFTRPIIDALAEMGLECSLSGRNDLVCGDQKFSGNAQYSTNGRILHHGTLLLQTDTNVLSSVLKVDKEKMQFKAVKSHKSRVVNLNTLLEKPLAVEEFIESIEAYVLRSLKAERVEESGIAGHPNIEALRARNASDEWIYSDKRYLTNYTVYKKKKFPFGVVCAEMTLLGDVIESIRLSGDFFGISPLDELEASLVGGSIRSLSKPDISKYVSGMTLADLQELLNS